MAETLRRSRKNIKTKKERPVLKIFLRILIVTLIALTIFFAIGFLKKNNIKKTNDNPNSFPVSVQNQGVFYVENS